MMYKIEKFLIDNHLTLKRKYGTSGVLVYGYRDEDGFFGDEVVLFPNHNPTPEWEIHMSYPFDMCLMSYREQGQEFIDNCKDNLEDHITSWMEFEKKLKAIDNPWEVIEDGSN